MLEIQRPSRLNDKIIRYPLPANVLVPSERPHLVVSGLPLTVIIRCTRSLSMRKATCSSISARRPIRARNKIVSVVIGRGYLAAAVLSMTNNMKTVRPTITSIRSTELLYHPSNQLPTETVSAGRPKRTSARKSRRSEDS